jgi:UDP-N-acetylglucosamine 2-epimerase
LIHYKDRFTRTLREDIRRNLDIPQNAIFVLFASQPLSLLFGTDDSNPLFPGYTEISVLVSLIDSLDRLQDNTSQEIVLVIRPHPRESVHGLNKTPHKKIRVVVTDKGDSRDIALASDLVTGMTSMFLVEASYLGCTVISLQPGHTKPDPLPTNRSGLSIAVYTDAEIFPTLKRVLKQHKLTNYADTREVFFSDGRSTQRVIELIQMLIT